MSQQSSIEWTDATWNPVTGCDIVSPGCKHCYAMALAPRLRAMGNAKYQDVNDGQPPTSGPAFGVTLHESELANPLLRKRKGIKVFTCSMGDLFHEAVPSEFIARVFAAMADAPQHTFQVLTKRPERMRAMLRNRGFFIEVEQKRRPGESVQMPVPAYLPNVWLGTSIESRTYVGRADHLRATPAAVRFISAEPLLGPLVPPTAERSDGRGIPGGYPNHGERLSLARIDWLIVGGESGPGHRPIDPDWVRDLRDTVIPPGIRHFDRSDPYPAFFFKQWGGRTPKAGGRELDGRTWDEFPEPARAVA